MKIFATAAAASALMAGTAFAGNVEPAPMEPVIAPAAAPVFTSPNWTGFYAGGQLGYGSVDADGAFSDNDDDDDDDLFEFDSDGDGFIGGLTAGYDYDLGNFVVGAGVDYDFADIDVDGDDGDLIIGDEFEGATIESIFRAKLRGGYKLGNGLLYATGGYAIADTDDLGDEDGYFVGGGYEHLITDNMSLGGEVLYHQFEGFGDFGDIDADVTTAQVRATFRF
jgi:opacity protein-like surface antigen